MADSAASLIAPLRARRYSGMNWVGLRTLFEREIRRFLKVSAQTLIAPLITTILYISVFALALGGRGAPIGGVAYIDFLAPGLIMMGVINNAFQNASSSLIIAKIQGNSVDFLMPPLSALELTIAFIGGAAARGIIVGLASLVAIAPFADLAPDHWWAVLLFIAAASVIFGAIGLLGGVWADKFDHLAAVTNFIITPLTFLSGTFYSINGLPEPIRDVAHYNPVFLLIDGFRYGFIGHADGPIVWAAAVSVALAAILSTACWALIKSGWRLKA
ncbi:MAG: antibiotic transport system permease protein [Alphaproteobacteria bacterium]|nr:MAG: antibiotic transport system permease protein [Alphaproteobacteria bacterium]